MTTIVVGGGASGAALAARLSEDPARRVVLLESGDASGRFCAELLDSSTVRGAVPGHPANWSYPARLRPGRDYAIARGRILGGSSTINGAAFVRARRADHEAWAAAGGARWSSAETLAVWRAIETDADYPASPLHGDRGPVPVRREPATSLSRAFEAAALDRGHVAEPDKNGDQPAGVGPTPSNIVDGVRVNMALAYLEPARSRPNLAIRGGTTVSRVLFAGSRAIGVETPGGELRADEVVLCAGAIGTARILLASGVGPRAQLEALGIRVVVDAPVGAAFSDHPQLSIGWRTDLSAPPAPRTAPFPISLAWDSSRVGAHPDGDVELLLAASPLEYLLNGMSGVSRARERQVLVGLQRAESRGTIALVSADPAAPARIDYGYLAGDADRTRLRAGVRETLALLGSAAFAEALGARVELADSALRDPDADDRELDQWMLRSLGTAIHMCGTAPMGAVVDGDGAVRGVRGLRVADTSVLPTAPARGPFASAVLVGEVIARAVRDGG